MGTKPPKRPDTLDPEILMMIDRYVSDVMADAEAPRGRLARASGAMAPIDDFLAPPSIDPDAVALVNELAVAMADAPEFVDESPTDLSTPPLHVPSDDEDTFVYSGRRPR